MNSLWESFSQGRPSQMLLSESPGAENDSTLQSLLLLLTNSHLSDMSINGRLYPNSGGHLGQGATFFVEWKEAKGRKLVAVKHIIRDEKISAVDTSYSAATRYRLRNLLLEAQALLHYPLIKHQNIVDIASAAIRETIDILLKHGADVNESSDDGTVPLHWIVARTTCLDEVLETFLSHHPSANAESEISKVLYLAAVAL